MVLLIDIGNMIKGKTINNLSPEDILEKTHGGYDIFKHYLGSISRQMNRPWGRKEKKLSWGVFCRHGVWLWKDMATEETGNAFHMVEKMFGLTFNEAKKKICFDFGFSEDVVNASPVKIEWQAPKIEKEYVDIGFTEQSFKKKHHEFWNCVEVSEDYCKKYNCFAVKDLAINRKRVSILKDEMVFAYYAEDEDRVKIYFPEREKDKKFKSNVNYHYLWNFENLQDCDSLIIQKSNKDMIVTSLVEPCVIATQSEAVKIFDAPTVDRINSVSKKPWVWYGSDWDGVEKCKEITNANKWRYINTPSNLLPDINDVYGYVKRFGIKELENFMKLKKLIK